MSPCPPHILHVQLILLPVTVRVWWLSLQGHGLRLFTWRMSNVWLKQCRSSAFDMRNAIMEMESRPSSNSRNSSSSQSDFPFALQGHSAGPAQQALTQLFYLSAPPCVHKFSINASFWYVETRNAACHKHHKLRKTLQNNVRKLWNVNAYEMCAYPDWHLPQIYAVLLTWIILYLNSFSFRFEYSNCHLK